MSGMNLLHNIRPPLITMITSSSLRFGEIACSDSRSARSGGSGGGPIGSDTVVQSAVFAVVTSDVLLPHMTWMFVIIADVEAKSGGFNVAVAPEKESPEDGLGHEVKDTVEDTLGIRRNDIATLAEAPCDGV